MALTLIQTAKAVSVTALTGGDFGPGTRGMLGVTATFGTPLTKDNFVIFAVQGTVDNAGSHVTLGPELAFVNFSGAHSGIFVDYWFAVTYTDAAGTETMAGIVGNYSNDQVTVSLSYPNVNNNAHPGFSTWSVYASKTSPTSLTLQSAGIGPTTGWSAALSAITSGGAAPPTSPIHDTRGISFATLDWIDQIVGGSNSGLNAMGHFAGIVPANGSEAIKFVCGALNANAIFTINGVLSIVAAEFSGTLGSNVSKASLQQAQLPSPLVLTTTNSVLGTDTTDWDPAFPGPGFPSGHVAMVTDESPTAGTDNLFASLVNVSVSDPPPDPPTPTLTPGVRTYVFIDSIDAPAPDNGHKLWFWYNSTDSPPPPGSAHLALRKQVNGSANPTSWTVKADNSTDHLSGAGSVARTAVTPGVFVLTETGGVVGYSGPTLSLTGTGGLLSGNLLTLADGDDVTVIFINSNCSGLRSSL